MINELRPLATEDAVEVAYRLIFHGGPGISLHCWTQMVQIPLATLFTSASFHLGCNQWPIIDTYIYIHEC